MLKYRLLRDQVLSQEVLLLENLFIPEAATDEQLLRAHCEEYVWKVKEGRLTEKEIRRLGFPWTPQLVERARRSVGGTISACRAALQSGTAVNLAGGTHHAFPDYGAGFCVFNDIAVAARTMRIEAQVERLIIIDCDVHQGDGTAAILGDDPAVFTFSIHGARNFPFHKQRSDLDIELDDGTEDQQYLEKLEIGLKRALPIAQANLAVYLAGADPYRGDRLGHLKMSKKGLAQRDRLVFALCAQHSIPIAVVMAGGYARDIQDIVDIHLQTIRLAAQR